ncbi:guanine nucleotide exchange factor LTE1 [Diplogelasinospora grovesii]|uniref:Guanine nucleotide exchange factor LTE1 n=1 Tax=Diplogelasinospora grovesii TaxID=303347 RepID=A0AAN6S6D9_9PEZI|nr:guanine nucleotide exchange factor LTE1 [Diplogelasinospora grovesii]
MEADSPSAPPAIAPLTTTRLRQQQLAQREVSVVRDSSTKAQRDARFRRTPPRVEKDGEQATSTVTGGGFGVLGGKSRAPFTPAAFPRSLLPVTERKSQEENTPARKTGKGSQEEAKWEIAPDGGSAGREGRQFTVANVGNNGRIYLRPTARPAHQRFPQPHFVFPMTPPGTAGLEALTVTDKGREAEDSTALQDSQWTPSPAASTPTTARRDYLDGKKQMGRPGHRRALSDSTVPDTSVARESEPGGFKVVITQPGEEPRPKTLEGLDPNRAPLLQVSIPSWRIGTPRFSIRGTPMIRGSSYAPTEDIRSSNASLLNRTAQNATPNNNNNNTPRGPVPVPVPVPTIQLPSGEPSTQASLLPPLLRSTYASTHMVIKPAMFDSLTFKPACDDKTIVKYSSATGAVTAATPPRLVAEITSPSFLDYELISDFFLTYRSFLEPSDLVRMLLARLRWALARDDETGLVVRVRTFVALRHWILNYFLDDFVVDYNLRVTFCSLLNDFVDELSKDARGRKVQLKILAELKKCWRRVCGHYWDGPEFDANLGLDIPISPGGIAGHRDPNLDPSFWQQLDAGPPQLDSMLSPLNPRDQTTTSFYADVSRAGHIDSIVLGDRPGTPENPPQEDPERRLQTSPTSITSVDAISCSFPAKTMRFAQPGSHYPLAAHPVDPSSIYDRADPIATTPRALTGKRVRPQQSHKRNGSLSDSLREHAATVTEKVLFKNAEFLLTLPYAGSLVRGNLFPPSQPFVEVLPPSGAGGPSRQTTLFQPHELPNEKIPASAMSGHGMRKLLGSVRRALSTKGQGMSPTQGNFLNISPIGPRGATMNRLPGTAIVPQARPRQNGVRPPVRIDLLGAEVAEDFKKAVREDAAAEAEKHGHLEPPAAGSRVPGEMLEYSAAHMDTTLGVTSNLHFRPTSDTGITAGSKSIVIVDDTVVDNDHPTMTGALPAANSSVEAFAESFMPNVSDPTPPNTPPGRAMGTPRRSSYVLSQHVVRPSLSADPLPPFVPDMATLGPGPRPSQDSTRSSFDFVPPNLSRPPLSGVRGHFRRRSSKSYRSNHSLNHRRYASFTSGIVPQPTVRSFDATTYSGASLDDSSQVMVPQPLRVLRRRPGGDLRAVTNVGDLDPTTLRRSRSVGSLTTYTDSVRSSYLRSPAPDSSGFVDVVTSDYAPNRGVETFSLGAIAEQNPKRNLSLFSTHSSKPIMRPSFEAEAQKLAQIPDDLDDDGGVESALLKLEGKYEKRAGPRLSFEPLKRPLKLGDLTEFAAQEPIGTHVADDEEKKEHRHIHLGDDPSQLASSPTIPAGAGLQGSFLHVARQREDVQSFLSEETRASYCSIPLLERGLTDDGRSRRTREWTDRSILQGPGEEGHTPSDGQSVLDSQHPSYDFIKKTDSMDKIQPGGTMPTAEPPRHSTEQSFLDIGSDDDSDLSSEMSADNLDTRDDEDSFFAVQKKGTALLPVHPLGDHPSGSTDPPSPPITLIQALHMRPEGSSPPEEAQPQIWNGKPLPPTPDTTPTTAAAPYTQSPVTSTTDPTGTKEALRNAPRLEIPDPVPQAAELPRNKFSVHLPFILAFDSDVLAQQFTLIEKDALNEIDWKDLIDMRWKNADHNGINSRSWVSFLRDTDARGVEVVIARFNIMVKWAISEIVLTQDIEERARCIIKYIHIAAHCRRYRNFATMAQLTIALTSNEISRLNKTWAMVPPGDQRTMHDLVTLISPPRNFYALRAEMEGGGAMGGPASAEMGCIPFVGIYTHDLLFNSQRPSEIASSPTTPPLVNFERCRTSAGVVKTLLRLIEASAQYTFQPIEGITERCLWMGALTDEEIRKLGDSLE